MSSSVVIKSSTIHGKGVFARKEIAAGAMVGVYEGQRTADNGTYVLWIEQDDGSELGIDGHNDLRFLNHSSRPNCEFDGPDLLALTRISPGQELTFHYGDDWTDIT